MTRLAMPRLKARGGELFPGIAVSPMVGAAASFLAEHYATPRLLLALLPGFAIGFLLLAAINSSGWLPSAIPALGSDLSQTCLVTAIAALGMKTRLQQLARVGLRPILLMLLESALLVGLVIGCLRFSN